jgi:cell fate (sporulation/competence/biofilm development) regulator YmcA (YheA/YmcA/DUF963 family)
MTQRYNNMEKAIISHSSVKRPFNGIKKVQKNISLNKLKNVP